MKRNVLLTASVLLLIALLLSTLAGAASKVHVITFGRPIAVQWFADSDSAPVTMRVRPLLVDGRIKEHFLDSPHEITDRVFVVRRAFRANDGLPDESAPRWQWQRGGWLLVDRATGRVSPATLPAFDAYFSAASWYRDYVAYCGVGEDGKKTYAVVAQLNRRKPVLRKAFASPLKEDAGPDSICPAPVWQKNPVRVSFAPEDGEKQTFSIRGSAIDVVNDSEEEE